MKNIFIGMLVLITMTFYACKTSPKVDEKAEKIKVLEERYNKFNDLSDNQSSIYVLHELLELDSSKTEYYDSLALLYVREGNVTASEKMAKQSVGNGGGSDKMLELSAMLAQQKGDIKEATDKYNQLFDRTSDYKYKMQIASMNVEMGDWKYGESMMKELLEVEKIDSFSFPVRTGQTTQEDVPMSLAIYLSLADVEVRYKNNPKKSLSYVNKALMIDPKNQLALYFKQQLIGARR